MKRTEGIHHITAIVGHPQENVDFYAGVLGLRLIKRTVNFDDPGTYHLYFGDNAGKPGTIITFFPWTNRRQGKIGGGQVGVTTYLIPTGSMAFWEERLSKFDVAFQKEDRFQETYLKFMDPHGLHLEFVERGQDGSNQWTFGDVTSKVAIQGFGGAVLYSTNPTATIETLVGTMGLEQVGVEGDLVRLQAPGAIGNIIDIKKTVVPQGELGIGTVHHIAWRAKDEADHLDWRAHVLKDGHAVTEVKDRNYFKAIYYREPGGILFEIASDTPGFAHDESYETMGQGMMLPEQYEHLREQLTAPLIPFEVREVER